MEVLRMSEERRDSQQNSPVDYQGTSQAWKPVLVVGAVVLVIALLSNQHSFQAQDEDRQNGSDSFKDVAIMGGVKRTNLSKDFRGGTATAVMGGIELDLRHAIMDRGEAVLDVSSVMGGVKVRVPASWTVVSRVSSVMGGFKDDTHHPGNEDHRLVLKGTVLMGGLTVMN
jgi:Cell wall-active antibiotics response 4TMS YvqF